MGFMTHPAAVSTICFRPFCHIGKPFRHGFGLLRVAVFPCLTDIFCDRLDGETRKVQYLPMNSDLRVPVPRPAHDRIHRHGWSPPSRTQDL